MVGFPYNFKMGRNHMSLLWLTIIYDAFIVS